MEDQVPLKATLHHMMKTQNQRWDWTHNLTEAAVLDSRLNHSIIVALQLDHAHAPLQAH